MAKYIITDGSVVNMGEKTSMEVTFIDEVNGKTNCTCRHEIESTDSTVIAEQLSLAALEYEARAATSEVVPTLVTGEAVTAEVTINVPTVPDAVV